MFFQLNTGFLGQHEKRLRNQSILQQNFVRFFLLDLRYRKIFFEGTPCLVQPIFVICFIAVP